jgi:hypothetical protein
VTLAIVSTIAWRWRCERRRAYADGTRAAGDPEARRAETGHSAGGGYGDIKEVAAAEKINPSYVSRVLRLTLLSPDIVEAILDGRQPEGVSLPALMRPFSLEWHLHSNAQG